MITALSYEKFTTRQGRDAYYCHLMNIRKRTDGTYEVHDGGIIGPTHFGYISLEKYMRAYSEKHDIPIARWLIAGQLWTENDVKELLPNGLQPHVLDLNNTGLLISQDEVRDIPI